MPPQNSPLSDSGNEGVSEVPAAVDQPDPSQQVQSAQPMTNQGQMTAYGNAVPQATMPPQPDVVSAGAPPATPDMPISETVPMPQSTVPTAATNTIPTPQPPSQTTIDPAASSPLQQNPPMSSPVVSSVQAPGASAMPPQPAIHTGGMNVLPVTEAGGKKKKLLLLAVLGAAVIGIIIAAIIVMPKLFGSITLETYSGDDFTLQVPADFDKKENTSSGLVEFNEKDEQSTRSKVVAAYEAYPREITESQKDMILDRVKESIQSEIKDSLVDSENKLEDVKVEETEFRGEKALQITASVIDNKDKEIGKVKMNFVATTKSFYMVGIIAHESDPGLQKKMDTIINSFEVKQ